MASDRSSDRANLVVSWKAVAIGAITVALAALAGLAVVATIKNADTLSVVALAVAIVAFVIQILVFIVQAAASSQQEVRAQDLHGSTMSILSTIEEKAEGTRRDVSTINEKMLGAILGKAISETALSISPESPEFGGVVAERAAQLATPGIVSRDSYDMTGVPPTRVTEPYTFPTSSEVQRILPKIENLSPKELNTLIDLGRDQAQYNSGSLPYPGFRIARSAHGLIEKGLVQEDIRPRSGGPVHVLTDDGKVAARVLLADDVPPGLADDIPPGQAAMLTRARDSRAAAGMREYLRRHLDPTPRPD